MHFACMVVIPKESQDVESYIEQALAPFDENMDVPHIALTKEQIETEFVKFNIENPDVYMSPSHYAEDEHGYYLDMDGNAISTYNPKSQWDWYSIGGRWNRMLWSKLNRQMKNISKVNDVGWEGMRQNNIERAKENWEKSQSEDPAISYFRYGISKGQSFEEHMAESSHPLVTFSVITKDGEWVERKRNDEEPYVEWASNFFDRFIKDLDPEDSIAIVDLHI